MRTRYPVKVWPGMTFSNGDVLSLSARRVGAGAGAGGGEDGGGKGALGGGSYDAVLDKGGAWDWMRDEAPAKIPELLASIRHALNPGGGSYVVVTRQDGAGVQKLIQGKGFFLDGGYPLGQVWAYVLRMD